MNFIVFSFMCVIAYVWGIINNNSIYGIIYNIYMCVSLHFTKYTPSMLCKITPITLAFFYLFIFLNFFREITLAY